MSPLDLNIMAIVLTLVTAAAAIVCGICASRTVRPSGKPVWLSAANAGAGGVLISAAVVHLLADSVSDAQLQAWTTFPAAMTAFGAGFLTIMIVEAIAHSAMHSAVSPSTGELEPLVPRTATSTPASASDAASKPEASGHKRWQTCPTTGTRLCGCGAPTSKSLVGALAAASSLSLHSVVAGMGLGASSSTHTQFDLLLAVLAHKALAAFSLALLAAPLKPQLRGVLLSIFTLSTPLGVGIGMAVAQAAQGTPAIPLVIAFAAGTILYTGAFEIVQPELTGRSSEDASDAGHEGLVIAALAPLADVTPRLPAWGPGTPMPVVQEGSLTYAGKRCRSQSAGATALQLPPAPAPLLLQSSDSSYAPLSHGIPDKEQGPPPPGKWLGLKVASLTAGFALMSALAAWV